ncbi:MAG: PadR family transcriptional regulator [Bradyrhizobium sp.]|nr:PadR family transcriptional regulator [Bradyrhizobium sp.]
MTEKGVRLRPPDYVVLGMVGLGAQSGYDIKKSVRDSIRFFWTISEAQIYPSLDRLERAALVRGHSAPQGRRRRRNFDITPQGEAALRRWLASDEAMPFELRDIGLVKLFFADALDRADALALLQAVIERSRERVAALNRIEPEARRFRAAGTRHPALTLSLGIAFHKAIIDVCAKFEKEFGAAKKR